jgi:hypothetical protein
MEDGKSVMNELNLLAEAQKMTIIVLLKKLEDEERKNEALKGKSNANKFNKHNYIILFCICSNTQTLGRGEEETKR